MNGDTLLARLDRFSKDVGSGLQRINIQRNNPAMAPRFNAIGTIVPSSISENTLSDVIAFLLQPNGEHAQGPAFLRAFLEVIHVPQGFISENTAEVIREAFTASVPSCTRRMDILVDSGSSAVMIENKPFADDQIEQMDDYCRHLDNEYGEQYVAVYLSATGGDPDPSSLSPTTLEHLKSANRYVAITYAADLRHWLRECLNLCQSEHVRWFLSDFDDYLVRYSRLWGGDTMTSETDFIVEYATKSKENLEIALLVGASYTEIQRRCIHAFSERVRERLVALPDFSAWTVRLGDFCKPEDGISLLKESWDGRCEINLCPASSSGQNMFIGVFTQVPFDVTTCEQLFRKLNEFRRGRKPEQKWPWWAYLERYLNWREPSVLLALDTEQALDYVVGQLCSVAAIATPMIDEQVSRFSSSK